MDIPIPTLLGGLSGTEEGYANLDCKQESPFSATRTVILSQDSLGELFALFVPCLDLT
jgi:hypothetical protein